MEQENTCTPLHSQVGILLCQQSRDICKVETKQKDTLTINYFCFLLGDSKPHCKESND
jgi:hypothetical protein